MRRTACLRRPLEWVGLLRGRRLRRRALRAAASGRQQQALLLLRRAMRCCPRTLAASSMLAADILRQESATDEDLSAAAKLYRFVLRRKGKSSPLRARAHERLTLLACQQRANLRATQLLEDEGYEYRLSPQILSYPLLHHPERSISTPPPAGYAHVVDGVLPPGMLRAIQRAFAPTSPFWAEHRYRCCKSPFFSYVHSLTVTPRTGMDRLLARLHKQASAAFPQAARATQAEWWAHCRPHATGHQLHYD